jgi:hypothetical protein
MTIIEFFQGIGYGRPPATLMFGSILGRIGSELSAEQLVTRLPIQTLEATFLKRAAAKVCVAPYFWRTLLSFVAIHADIVDQTDVRSPKQIVVTGPTGCPELLIELVSGVAAVLCVQQDDLASRLSAEANIFAVAGLGLQSYDDIHEVILGVAQAWGRTKLLLLDVPAALTPEAHSEVAALVPSVVHRRRYLTSGVTGFTVDRDALLIHNPLL